MKSARWTGQQRVERGRLLVGRLGEDHPLHGRQPVAEEHVLGAAEPDALRAELARLQRVLGQVRVRAHLHRAHLVGPAEHDAERTGRLGRHDRHLADDDLAGATVDRDHVALAHGDLAPG